MPRSSCWPCLTATAATACCWPSIGETVLAAHTLLLGLPDNTGAGFTVDHASLTRWQHHRNRRGQQRWMLDRHNDTAHLAPEAAR